MIQIQVFIGTSLLIRKCLNLSETLRSEEAECELLQMRALRSHKHFSICNIKGSAYFLIQDEELRQYIIATRSRRSQPIMEYEDLFSDGPIGPFVKLRGRRSQPMWNQDEFSFDPFEVGQKCPIRQSPSTKTNSKTNQI